MANNKPYQSWQYFFWMISGSEISILKECPTDYNRHAGIGFTIFMTGLFGACAGGYAGYYFTKSIAGAIGFGLLWGLLIFSIDRTMVVSLKKKPNPKWLDHFWQILFRAILAALIAFIISIPLELLVFKGNIDAGLPFYKQSQALRLQAGQVSFYDPLGDASKKLNEDEFARIADSTSQLEPRDPEYAQIKSQQRTSSLAIAKLRGDLRVQQDISRRYYNRALFPNDEGVMVPEKSSDNYKDYLSSKTKEGVIGRDIRKVSNEIRVYNLDLQQRRNNWKIKYESIRDSASNNASIIEKEIQTEKAIMDSTNRQFDTTLKKVEQSFVVRFDVLTYLAKKKNPDGSKEFASIFFLLWLIRILFFVIEILPTIVKLATPFGAYDMAIYEAEENFKNIKLPAAKKLLVEKLSMDHQMEKTEKERQLSSRLKKEGELHDKILEEVSTTQDQIAKEILEKWKAVHLKSNGTI